MDKRPETRVPADIPVRAFGMDADGKPFFEKAVASNLSSEGAQLTRVQHSLKIGEIIGIQYGDKKARFEIKWVKPGFLPNTVIVSDDAGQFDVSDGSGDVNLDRIRPAQSWIAPSRIRPM